MKKFPLFSLILLTVTSLFFYTGVPASADWFKMNPPPDVDKTDHNDVNKNGTDWNKPTCWIAVASNMLAGAGYGDGNSVQERADEIYSELCLHIVDGNEAGWADEAIDAWLQSDYNKWSNTNPYTIIDVHGNKAAPRRPWAYTELPKFVANKLRACDMVRLSILVPDANANTTPTYGHAVTLWGDDANDPNELTSNPSKVKVSDSDYWNPAVNVQTYTYDDYNNPNPGGNNEGNGWYINYNNSDTHRYIDNVVTLSATDPNDVTPSTETLVASAQFQYSGDDPCALDLHYRIISDAKILTYNTSLDWDIPNEPQIVEEDVNCISVTWDLAYNPVPKDTTVTITAQIAVPYNANGSTVSLKNIYWTPLFFEPLVGSLWHRWTPELPGSPYLHAPNMCGGYVVVAFDVYRDTGTMMEIMGHYRYQFKYKYFQDPEHHEFVLEPTDPRPDVFVSYFRFGHSYGLLLPEELWQFNNWRTTDYSMFPFMAPVGPFIIEWPGQLPYPKGQYYVNPTAQSCDDPGMWYLGGDINRDCYVNFSDFALFAMTWMQCNDPANPQCH
ncbi:MAG: hypothetical protein ABIG61_14630 [Planctomycetota bacterium]